MNVSVLTVMSMLVRIPDVLTLVSRNTKKQRKYFIFINILMDLKHVKTNANTHCFFIIHTAKRNTKLKLKRELILYGEYLLFGEYYLMNINI